MSFTSAAPTTISGTNCRRLSRKYSFYEDSEDEDSEEEDVTERVEDHALLLRLFDNIWTTGDIPPSWTEASLVPIPKPGKDPSDPANYRPIALTSCLYDFAIYAEVKHLQHLERTIQLCINNVQKWVSGNGFQIFGFEDHLCPFPTDKEFTLSPLFIWTASRSR
ncbi:hypothetical protein PoB_005251100 [Plakobranchus ocellatus]|uniref:Uncharacterized protein n=1 Tax=Plakobranchus ocellatus TaxID=259542 RepID=A0AAV4BRZ9_9GAST|nr:hypothetical protein PoB_005251100 [Plakobranchus ocellatus]